MHSYRGTHRCDWQHKLDTGHAHQPKTILLCYFVISRMPPLTALQHHPSPLPAHASEPEFRIGGSAHRAILCAPPLSQQTYVRLLHTAHQHCSIRGIVLTAETSACSLRLRHQQPYHEHCVRECVHTCFLSFGQLPNRTRERRS